MYTPKIRNMLRTADRVAETGKRVAAVDLYKQVIEEDETIIEGWLGIGENALEESVKRNAFEQILKIDPENKEAANHIAALDGSPLPFPNLPKKEKVEPKPAPFPIKSDVKIVKRSQTATKTAPDVTGTSGKVEPLVGGVFPHPVDISEYVMPDGTMISYRAGIPTTLRCNRCGRPISSKDSKKTSVGYRCLICIKEIEEAYFEATSFDYVVATAITTVLALITGILLIFFGNFGFFFYFILFAVGGGIGTAIARLSHRAIGRRRGRYMPYIISGIIAAGGILPTLLISFSLFGLIGPIIYALSATSAAYYFLK